MKKYPVLVILGVASSFVLWKSCTRPDSRVDDVNSRTAPVPAETPQIPREKKIREILERGDTPIKFFGRVVDQDGRPLGGAIVRYKVQRAGNYLESGVIENTGKKGEIIAGANGRFEIQDVKGLTLAIGPLEKPLYRDGAKAPRSFGFNGTPQVHQPDTQNPVEFLMIRSDTPRTKEIYNETLEFSWNKGDVRIPLGQKLGDFVLTPTRTRASEEVTDFDWNITVRMNGAQLVVLEETSADIAPDTGFQKEFTYHGTKGDKNWHGGVQARYAFTTQDGRYGFAKFVLYAERDDLQVNGALEIRLNETGSRSLD